MISWDREVVAIGVFAMKKSGGNPGFSGNGYVYCGDALQFPFIHLIINSYIL
jgi:hypothetical protein